MFTFLPNVDTRDFIASQRLLFSPLNRPSISLFSHLLVAHHHVNSHFVIHSSFFYVPPAIVVLVVHISAPKKVFPLQRAQQKCIMHCGMSQIMFQSTREYSRQRMTMQRQNLCTQSKSLQGILRFSTMTPLQFFFLFSLVAFHKYLSGKNNTLQLSLLCTETPKFVVNNNNFMAFDGRPRKANKSLR